MLILKISIIAFFLACQSHGKSQGQGKKIKLQYKWNEKLQLCSFELNVVFNVMCKRDFAEDYDDDDGSKDLRIKRSTTNYEGLNADCCEKSCTPLHILKHYCESSKGVDLTKDFFLFPDMKDIGNNVTTKRPAISKQNPIHGILSQSKGQKIKLRYKWDKKVQLCSFELHVVYNVMCKKDFADDYDDDDGWEDLRIKRNVVRDFKSLNADCCEKSCTPLHILKNYCDSSKGVDLTKDFFLFPDMKDIGKKVTTTEPTTTTQFPVNGNITTAYMMYCYMGFKQFCYAAAQQFVSDVVLTIGHLKI